MEQLCSDLVNSPNANVGKLKNVLELYEKEKNPKIKKLIALSLVEVFKDICPKYTKNFK